jgi:hypothetical protein
MKWRYVMVRSAMEENIMLRNVIEVKNVEVLGAVYGNKRRMHYTDFFYLENPP